MLARNMVSDFVRGEIEKGADPEEMKAALLQILKESFEEALSIKIIKIRVCGTLQIWSLSSKQAQIILCNQLHRDNRKFEHFEQDGIFFVETNFGENHD